MACAMRRSRKSRLDSRQQPRVRTAARKASRSVPDESRVTVHSATPIPSRSETVQPAWPSPSGTTAQKSWLPPPSRGPARKLSSEGPGRWAQATRALRALPIASSIAPRTGSPNQLRVTIRRLSVAAVMLSPSTAVSMRATPRDNSVSSLKRNSAAMSRRSGVSALSISHTRPGSISASLTAKSPSTSSAPSNGETRPEAAKRFITPGRNGSPVSCGSASPDMTRSSSGMSGTRASARTAITSRCSADGASP